MDTLLEIVEHDPTLTKDLEIYVDGGVRRGTDGMLLPPRAGAIVLLILLAFNSPPSPQGPVSRSQRSRARTTIPLRPVGVRGEGCHPRCPECAFPSFHSFPDEKC